MRPWKWNPGGALLHVPIFYKVVLANSAMAGVVIAALLLLHHDLLAAAGVVLGCGVVNALLVRASFAVEHLRGQQREVLAWTLAQSERERGRVAAEIHEGAVQRLAALVLRSPGAADISTEATAVMHDLCDTASTLQPPGMRMLGLQGALTWYARALEQRSGMHVVLDADCPMAAVDPDIALGAYRLIEDILTTASNAGVARVELRVLAHNGHLDVSTRMIHCISGSASFRVAERVALLNGTVESRWDGILSVLRITIPARVIHA